MRTTSEIFRENLKRLRKERFPKQEDFADKVNLSTRGYQKYETGESQPTPDVLDRFSKQIGCPITALLTDDNLSNESEDFNSSSVFFAGDVLSRLARLSRERRAFVLALIFRNEDYLKALPPKLVQAAQILLKAP